MQEVVGQLSGGVLGRRVLCCLWMWERKSVGAQARSHAGNERYPMHRLGARREQLGMHTVIAAGMNTTWQTTGAYTVEVQVKSRVADVESNASA